MPMGAALELDHVSRNFGGIVAVDDVSFDVARETVTSLVGPNGAGKTTLFNLISGLLPMSSGEIRFNGQALGGLPPHAIARLGIGRTFQDPRIFYEMTVLEHVTFGFRLRGEGPLRAVLRDPAMRAEWRNAEEKALALLAEIGLHRQAGEKAQDLSFGEQRFLSIARTLASDPQIVLLDEPTVGLDRDGIKELSRIIIDMVRRRGKTALIVEHNLDVVLSLSDQIHLLVGGKLALSGKPDEIKRHPTMIEAYMGTRYAALRR
jgi:branched-chain amino acid transport system ATP-binding protein